MAQKINVDTTPGLLMPTLYFSQGDIGREFEINLSSKDGFTIPAGATVKMVATKPSGFGFEVTGTLTGTVASFTTTETMTNESGRFPAEIRIEYSGDVIGTANFMLSGEINPHPDGTIDGDAEEIIPELTVLVERAEAAASLLTECSATATTLSAGSDATASYDPETGVFEFGVPKGADGSLTSGVLAPTYSSSATYAVGDYVYYSGNLYRCTTAITTAEAWTSGHWTQVALAPEVSDLKSDLTLTGIEQISYVKTGTGNIADNKFITYSSPGSGYNYMMLIDDADIIARIKHIKAYLGNNTYKYGIAFVDSGGNELSPYGEFPSQTATAQTIEVDVPANTAKIYIYNRYSVLENPRITITTTDGYEARIAIAEADIDELQDYIDNKNMLAPAYVKNGYWYNAGGSGTGDYDYYIVPVENGVSYTISKGIRFLSKQSSLISQSNPVTADETTYTADFTGNLYITFSNAIDGIYCCKTAEYQEGAGWFNKKILAQSSGSSECAVMSQKAVTDLVSSSNNDILYGKKWVACGDSFTHGDFTGLTTPSDYIFQDEPYKNQNKVYPFYIGRRTGANVVNEAVNGSTMAYIDGSRSEFSTPSGRYTQIPSDADYITLYFGINDSHQNVPIGTIDDAVNTTFYGAWNIVMDYLTSNYPTAKIGIIISNGCDSIDYPNAEIAIAKKWGVSYFDMNGDYKIPLVYRVNGKPDLCQDIVDLRTLQYRVSSSNGHPNAACHEDESTFIESWLKSI